MLMKDRNRRNLTSWLTYLQHVGLTKGDFDYTEEAFLSNEYRKFKNSALGQLLNNKITITLEGSCFENSEKEIVVFSVLNNNTGLQGVSGITVKKELITIVPIQYDSIEIVELSKNDDLFFIAKRVDKKDLYTSNGELLISSLSYIQPLYYDELRYEPENENVKIKDLTYELRSSPKLRGYLVKKEFPINHSYIKSMGSDKNSEFETVFGWRDVEKLEFEDTVSYSIFRDVKKHTNKDCVTIEGYLDIKMFEEPNKFKNKLFKEEF